MLGKASVRANTESNYDSQWRLFETYCGTVHTPPTDPLMLSPSLVQRWGGLVVGLHAEGVLLGFIGWLTTMVKGDPPAYHYKASTICKYTRSVRQSLETKCGLKFGSAGIPALVHIPRSLRGVIQQRGEGTLERLVVAPQHLLNIAEYEGIILTPQHGRGPRVSFARDYFTDTQKQMKLAYFGACLDGWVLTMRSMEYLSKGDTFNPLAELSRADVRYNDDYTGGAMFIKRYKGDKNHKWPVKQLAPAKGGRLCCLAVRLAYENINPVPLGTPLASVPYWQQPDGRPITRTRLQNFLQAHMKRMGAPEQLYKTHSLRKGGVTAMLHAGVPLPQIQLMARWVSPNMAQLYAALTAEKSADVLSAIGGIDTLSVSDQEQKFWQTYTNCPG